MEKRIWAERLLIVVMSVITTAFIYTWTVAVYVTKTESTQDDFDVRLSAQAIQLTQLEAALSRLEVRLRLNQLTADQNSLQAEERQLEREIDRSPDSTLYRRQYQDILASIARKRAEQQCIREFGVTELCGN